MKNAVSNDGNSRWKGSTFSFHFLDNLRCLFKYFIDLIESDEIDKKMSFLLSFQELCSKRLKKLSNNIFISKKKFVSKLFFILSPLSSDFVIFLFFVADFVEK